MWTEVDTVGQAFFRLARPKKIGPGEVAGPDFGMVGRVGDAGRQAGRALMR